MIALRRAWPSRIRARAFCELDRWSFDPRYTDGRCPICGWQQEGAPNAPAWLMLARRVEWELLGLFALLIVLVVLGLVVARAAGITLPALQVHQGAPASAPRTTSPAPRTASPAPRTSPSPTSAVITLGDPLLL